MDAALQAHFRSPPLPSLVDPPLNFHEIEVIGPTAQVLAELTLREGAELTAEIADIGVVDVAGHDIADLVALDPLPKPVSRLAYGIECFATRAEELHDVGLAELFSVKWSIEYCGETPVTLPRPACGERVGVRGSREGRCDSGAWHPIVSSCEPLCIDCPQHGGAQRRIEPALWLTRISRVDCQPLDQRFTGGSRLLGQPVERRPWSLRVDVVRGDWRNPAPIVDPGGDHFGKRSGVQIGWRLDVHLGPEDQPCHGNRPEMVLEVRLGRVRHPRPGFGAEILNDDF